MGTRKNEPISVGAPGDTTEEARRWLQRVTVASPG